MCGAPTAPQRLRAADADDVIETRRREKTTTLRQQQQQQQQQQQKIGFRVEKRQL